jgi:enoyl-[acyl-carrier-protein] reductase (NADH)
MKKSQKQALAVGAGVAALAAAAGAAYMLTGKNAKNRKKVATWAKNMEKDVLKELKKVKQNSQSAYNQAVDTVVKNYKAAKKVKAPELAAVASDLKSHWDVIRMELENASKTVRRIKPKARASRARKVKVKKSSPKRKR